MGFLPVEDCRPAADPSGCITYVSKEYFKDIQQEDAKSDKEQSYRFYQEWMKICTGDINFVIDTILMDIINNNDGVYMCPACICPAGDIFQ